MSEHYVDLDALDGLSADMRNLMLYVTDALTEVQQRMNRLHDGDGAAQPWTGDTAAAARAAMDRWTTGAQQMRDGLDTMEIASKHAHTSYAEGVEAVLYALGRGGAVSVDCPPGDCAPEGPR
ncbi:WXG100 family type VII secretion target [Nocardia rhamnosiphila]